MRKRRRSRDLSTRHSLVFFLKVQRFCLSRLETSTRAAMALKKFCVVALLATCAVALASAQGKRRD